MLKLSMICKELVFREIDISVRFCQKVLLMCVILTTCTWYNEITRFFVWNIYTGTFIQLFWYFVYSYMIVKSSLNWVWVNSFNMWK